jgi:hypothetical protein
MIKFLNLKNQLEKNSNSFAFYDTISNSILTFGYSEYGNIDIKEIFNSKEDFIRYYNKSRQNDPDRGEKSTRPLKRFIDLIPKDYFD